MKYIEIIEQMFALTSGNNGMFAHNGFGCLITTLFFIIVFFIAWYIILTCVR